MKSVFSIQFFLSLLAKAIKCSCFNNFIHITYQNALGFHSCASEYLNLWHDIFLISCVHPYNDLRTEGKRKKKNTKTKEYKKNLLYFEKTWLFFCNMYTVCHVSHHFYSPTVNAHFCKLITYLTFTCSGICLCHLQGVLDCCL